MTRMSVLVVAVCLLLAAAGYAGVDAASQALLGDEERVAIEVEASVAPDGVADGPEWAQQDALGARLVETNETTRTAVVTPNPANGSGGELLSAGSASVPDRTDTPAATQMPAEATPTPTPDSETGAGQIPGDEGQQVSPPGTDATAPSTADEGPTAGQSTPEAMGVTEPSDGEATTGGDTGKPGDVDAGEADGGDHDDGGDAIGGDADGGEDGPSPNAETAGGDTAPSGSSADTDESGVTSGMDPELDGEGTGQ